MKYVFFGTSEFASIVLETLVQKGYRPSLVITTPDMPSGRNLKLTPPPSKVTAQNLGIPVADTFEKQETDLCIVAAYGKILSKELLAVPTLGTLNVHPSLLPKYRGPSPVQTVLLEGEKETGVTVMLLDEKMDHGPVLAQKTYAIPPNATYPQLHDALAALGAELLIETIPQWVEGKIQAVSQDDAKATYTKIFTKEDGRVDWNKSAKEIEQQVRAFTPWPGTSTFLKSQHLKILKASVGEGITGKEPGTAFLTQDKKLAIQCGEDALVLEELQLEGKKPMSSKDFLLGHQDTIGSKLGPN